MTPGISVIVPVFNAAASLGELVPRLDAVMRATGRPYELLLVDDCSGDNSWAVITELAPRHPAVRGIALRRNFGQHNATLCGLRAARFDLAVTLDDDLQNPPEEVPALLQRLEEGCDVVYGVPAEPHHGVWRGAASRLTKLVLQSSMGVAVAPDVSSFRALRTELREAFAQFSGPYVSIDVLLTWATTRFGSVKVRHDTRSHGASNYTLRQLTTHALNMVTGFSTLPLRLASLVGFGFTLFGMAMLVYVLGRLAITGGSVPGFPFLASAIAIFSGAQLFALGIIGEYLARIHMRTMERPSYIVASTIGD